MTNPVQFTKPMKACDANLDLLKFPIMVFPKIDGVRGLIVNGKLVGRSLKPHKNEWLRQLLSQPKYSGLDGELSLGLVRDITSQSLCRDTTSAVNTIKGDFEVTFNCFDLLDESTVDLCYMSRYMKLTALVRTLPCFINLIGYDMCNSKEEVLALYDMYIEQGYEGIVLRDPEAMHKNGRSTALKGGYLRLKPSGDAEGIFHHFDEAMHNGNKAKRNELGELERSSHKANKTGLGMIGAFWLTPRGGGTPFKIGPGKMCHKLRTYYFENPDFLNGQIMKFKYFDHGAKDAYRHARFISFRAESDMECK